MMRLFEFDGTRRGFDLMMLRLYPDQNWAYFVSWLDENLNDSRLFNGIVKIKDVVFRKGSWYLVKGKALKDE